MFNILIMGRPNVGKSSLFNRLVGKKKSIVADRAGVTRDRIEAIAGLLDLEFKLTDTGGIFGEELKNISDDIKQQISYALEKADLVFFVVDAKAGLTSADMEVANFLFSKKLTKPVVVIANKAESGAEKNLFHEFYRLSFQEIIAISTAHNLGMEELYDVIAKYHISEGKREKYKEAPLMISVVGRPNSGKSTLINAILNEDRMITGELAGLTRDSVDTDFIYKDQVIRLVDTAGIRKRKYIDDDLEKFSVDESLNSIKYSQIVILLIDAVLGFEQHEMSLANKVITEGRNLIIAINKWDLIKDKNSYFQEIKLKIEESLPQISGVAVLYISAKQKKNIDKLLDACFEIYKIWNLRISTGKLNNWLKKVTESHSAGLSSNKRPIKVKYITQYKSRPPRFKLFCNIPEAINDNYLRYLANNMRKEFGMYGVVLKLEVAETENPYDKSRKAR